MALPATRLPLLLVFYFIHFLALSHGQASCDGINDLEPFSTVWDISLKTTVTQVATVAYPDPSATVNNPATSTPQVTAVYLAVNGKWPADPIVVQKCQQVTIRVRNNIEPVKVWPNDLTPGFAQEEVTLHFHGLTQKDGRVIMDGPEGLTQNGIQRGREFTYSFLADQEGTYWIHSHHGGQYPKGVRAPFVVLNKDDPDNYGYARTQAWEAETQEIVTLSDWFTNFWQAEERGTGTDDTDDYSICGTGGKLAGIEQPPDRVLFNDYGGYETLPSPPFRDKRIMGADCGTTRRLRFINMASHAKFYVWFSDSRSFRIIELDGISYNPVTTTVMEIASGQRASILVDAPANNCKPAYIIVASDPKVGHGTRKCPQKYTNSLRGVQYTHGFFDVRRADGQWSSMDDTHSELALDPTDSKSVGFLGNLMVYSEIPASTEDAKRWHYFPPEGTLAPPATSWKNRLQLNYQNLWYHPNDPDNFGAEHQFGREALVTGLVGTADFPIAGPIPFKPKASEAAWLAPKPADGNGNEFIHYVRLGSTNNGLAAMMENPNKNDPEWWKKPGTFNPAKWAPWVSPGNRPGFTIPITQRPEIPSLFRALNVDLNADNLKNPAHFSWEDPSKGHTIMVNDITNEAQPENSAHWFVLRSDLGDHPMHIHGHHFQILAILPPQWFVREQKDVLQLWNFVAPRWTSNNINNSRNPPRRDTLWLEKSVTYVIAIKPDNPGVWAFHCHNDIHAKSGMFSQVIERPVSLRNQLGTWKGTVGKSPDKDWDFTMTPGTQQTLSKAVEYAFGMALHKLGYRTGAGHDAANPFPPPPPPGSGRMMARNFTA